MTLSKQDFELIAERIYSYGSEVDVSSEQDRDDRRRDLAEHFASALASTNGMFQRDKFIRAATTGAHIRRSILPRA